MYDSSETGKAINMHLMVSKNAALNYVKRGKISIQDFTQNCRVLYNPIEVDKFENFRADIDAFRAKYGIDNDEPLIARVGRPDLIKWSRFTVDMFRILNKRMPKIRYLIVGGIPDTIRKEFIKIGLEKNIIDAGVLSEDDLLTAYYCIDALAHSSQIGESFGITIAEAMAAKKPVVVNSTPWADNAQVELVDHNVTGLIANSPRTYAEAIVHLLENKKETAKMGQAGYEKVKKEYDAKKVTKLLEKIYITQLNKKTGGVSKEITAKYTDLEYSPSDNDMLNFPEEYKKRLANQFDKLTIFEKVSLEVRPKLRVLKKTLRNLLS